MRKRFLVTTALALAASSVFAQSTPPAGASDTDKQLLEELRQLRARVEQLEQRAPTQAEIDATKARIDADVASKKTTVNLRYDKDGLFLGTSDETFTLKPQVLVTLRYTYNHRDEATIPGTQDEDNGGFEVRRQKLTLSGNVLSKQLTYGIDVTTQANGGGLLLNDAFVTYRLGEKSDWFIRGGQFKGPFSHEELTSDALAVAAESSMISQTLGGRAVGRVQGAGLIYNNYQVKDSPWNAYFVFTDGDKSLNTDFRQTTNNKFGAIARGEYKVFGDWKSYANLSHLDSKDDLLVFGAGVSTSQGDNTVYRFGADAQYEFADKWALYGNVLGAHTARDTGDDTLDYGAGVQLAYVLTPQFELFGRYNITLYENDQANGENRAQEATIGVNYLMGPDGAWWRQARLTLDVGFLPDGSPVDYLSENYLQGDGAQFVTRVQFRLIL